MKANGSLDRFVVRRSPRARAVNAWGVTTYCSAPCAAVPSSSAWFAAGWFATGSHRARLRIAWAMRVAVARRIAERKHLSERGTDRVARRQCLEMGHEDTVEFATLVVIEFLLPADLGVSQHEQGDGRHLPDRRLSS